MTDNEVIKELQAASKWFTEHGRNTNTAIIGICERAIDHINRQKAEIERLREINSLVTKAGQKWQKRYELADAQRNKAIVEKYPYIDDVLADARAEAVKEFAERLKEELTTGMAVMRVSALDIIDNLVKEFTE